MRTAWFLALTMVSAGCSGAQGSTVEQATPPSIAPGPAVPVSLRIDRVSELDEVSGEPPHDRVTLVVGDREVDLGEHDNCGGGGSSLAPAGAQELDGALCWWAGAGDVISVWREGDEVVAAVMGQTEEEGNVEPVELARIPIPPDARVVEGPDR